MQTKPNLLAILPVVWLQIWSEIFAWMWWKKQWRQVKHAKHIETYRNRLKTDWKHVPCVEGTRRVMKYVAVVLKVNGWSHAGSPDQPACIEHIPLHSLHLEIYRFHCFTMFHRFHMISYLPPTTPPPCCAFPSCSRAVVIKTTEL